MSMLSWATMESRGTVGMIGEPARAEEAELFAGVPDEEDGAAGARPLARELLRDLEHGHRARTVVIGAVEHGVHAWRVLFSQRVDVHVDRARAAAGSGVALSSDLPRISHACSFAARTES